MPTATITEWHLFEVQGRFLHKEAALVNKFLDFIRVQIKINIRNKHLQLRYIF
jgi:hypothetical protein